MAKVIRVTRKSALKRGCCGNGVRRHIKRGQRRRLSAIIEQCIEKAKGDTRGSRLAVEDAVFGIALHMNHAQRKRWARQNMITWKPNYKWCDCEAEREAERVSCDIEEASEISYWIDNMDSREKQIKYLRRGLAIAEGRV